MKREAQTQKLMILGVDGLDPRLTRKYVDEGKMPTVKKIIEMGAQRDDLVLLGSQPTVTPPQWTTLATGANPVVHGICQFNRIIPGCLTQQGYQLDSRMVQAEPAWNPITEAGYKTFLLHWPGGAWPPTTDSENLYVLDGTAPGSAASAAFHVDSELLIGASVDITEVKNIARSAEDVAAPCVINNLPDDIFESSMTDIGAALKHMDVMNDEFASGMQSQGIETINVLMDDADGQAPKAGGFQTTMTTLVSPIKEATGWAAAPEGSREFTVLTSQGLIRRVGLIVKNDEDIFDHVEIYKTKKDTTPIAVLPVGKMVYNIVDEAVFEDKQYTCNRHMKLMKLDPAGNDLKLYISSALDMNDDRVIHPKRLQKAIIENVGPFPPQACIYTQDEELQQCTREVWDEVVEWYVRLIDYMVKNEGIQVMFSHLHSVDLQEHTFIHYMKGYGFNKHPEEVYAQWMEDVYMQVERYYTKLLHYLEDDGWTWIITSDHAQVAPSYMPPTLGDMQGINTQTMEELGYTVMKRDENGKKLKKIDWSKTRAIQSQGNDIYINLKGREPNGIVDPADKYELEEQIITDLYSLKHPVSGKRVVALALHNKDAVLLGYGGKYAGDVCFWIAEGYNYDHTDSLSTTYGEGSTSSSPIFIAAGPGFKKGFVTDRWIRQTDVAPTVCWLLGCRMPAQCEGAIIYQILEQEI